MTTYLQRYKKASLVDSCLPDMAGNENPAMPEIWAVDVEIRKAFAPYLAQYEQGLMHSIELMQALLVEINRERN